MGNKFLPPFMAMPFPLSPIDWVRDFVPDLLWLGLLIHKHGPTGGLALAVRIAQATKRRRRAKGRFYCFASDYEDTRPTTAPRIRQDIGSAIEEIQEAMYPLASLYRGNPLEFLFTADALDAAPLSVDDSISTLKYVTGELMDKRTRLAAITQAAAIAILKQTDSFRIPEGSGLEELSPILDYPDSEASQKVASMTRATVVAIGGGARSEFRKPSDWPQRFWRHGYTISTCVLPDRMPLTTGEGSEHELGDTNFQKLLTICQRYAEDLGNEVEHYWGASTPDIANPRRGEVLAGIVSREVRLASMIVGVPQLWSADILRILSRCQVESHVNLVWLIARANPDDFAAFVEYGLGQEKLFVEHLSSKVESRGTSIPGGSEFVERMRTWVQGQIMSEFLPVNVGDWTDKSVRDRASEVGLDDDYQLGYAPHSSGLHGTWNVLAQTHLQHCLNPLHRFHRVPRLDPPPPVLQSVQQACITMDESLDAWCEELRVKRIQPTAVEDFLQSLDIWMSASDAGSVADEVEANA